MNSVIKDKCYPVSNYPNQVLETKERAFVLKEIIVQIQNLVDDDQTLTVCPEGALINFLTKRSNPVRYMENHFSTFRRQGEDAIIKEYEKHSPDFILLLHRPEFEYGIKYIGQGYGENFMSWIKQNYHEKYLAGAMPFGNKKDFGALLLQRNDLNE